MSVDKQELVLIDQLTADLYSCISFNEGEDAPLAKLKEIFVEGGELIDNTKDKPLVMTLDEFVVYFKEQMELFHLHSFKEFEISGITEQFGKIAHRFSTFESQIDTNSENPKTLAKGINSMQMIKVGDKWLISSIIWCTDPGTDVMPERYTRTPW